MENEQLVNLIEETWNNSANQKWKDLPEDTRIQIFTVAKAGAVFGSAPVRGKINKLAVEKQRRGGLSPEEDILFTELRHIDNECIERVKQQKRP